ncbi:unnamed protein product [Calypogeia fissa]
MGMGSNLKSFIARDPVVAAAVILSLVGLALPVVVPPIRDAFSGTKPVPPPKLSEVVEGMTGKKQGSS